MQPFHFPLSLKQQLVELDPVPDEPVPDELAELVDLPVRGLKVGGIPESVGGGGNPADCSVQGVAPVPGGNLYRTSPRDAERLEDLLRKFRQVFDHGEGWKIVNPPRRRHIGGTEFLQREILEISHTNHISRTGRARSWPGCSH